MNLMEKAFTREMLEIGMEGSFLISYRNGIPEVDSPNVGDYRRRAEQVIEALVASGHLVAGLADWPDSDGGTVLAADELRRLFLSGDAWDDSRQKLVYLLATESGESYYRSDDLWS